MANETITLKLIAQDMMSGNVSKAIGSMDRLAKRGGLMGSVMQGVGQSFGQMLNPMNLASQGIGMVTDLLGDAVKAAMEDEKSVAQLTKTLQNNVTAFNGNTAAIDAAIQSAQNLAFSDDQVRTSLNLLLPRTKDVTEAIRLNALAMDLARFKGMSLEEAAGLVGKAFSGQTTALKRAGIAIKDNATSTEALAQLQKTVAGQAKAYGETTQGTFESLQISLDEVVETIGYELLPSLKDLAVFVRDEIVPGIKTAAGELGRFAAAAGILGQLVQGKYIQGGQALIDFFNDLTTEGKQATQATTDYVLVMDGLVPRFVKVGGAAKDTSGSLQQLARSTFTLTRAFDENLGALTGIVKGSLKSAKGEAEKGMAALTWALKHPMTEARLEKFYGDQVRKGTRAMNRALATGNTAAYAQAAAFVADYKAKLAELQFEKFHVKVQMDFQSRMGGIPGLGSYGSPRRDWSLPVGEARTGRGGAAPVSVHFHGVVAAPSEAETDRIARVIGPAIARHQRRHA